MAKKDKGQATPQTGKRQKRATLGALERGHIKSSMHLELQKFGDRARDKEAMGQLRLFEPTVEDSIEVFTTGLVLSQSKMRALFAIQKLLHETGYRGNMEPEEGWRVTKFKYRGSLPRVAFTYTAYLESYGVEKIRGRYQGNMQQEALAALLSLAQDRQEIYYHRRKIDGKYDVVRWRGPIVQLEEVSGYEGLTEKELKSLPKSDRAADYRGYIVTFSSIFVDGLDNFFAQIPTSLYDDIRKATGGGKHSQAIDLFVMWLLSRGNLETTIHKSLLAERLRLSHLLDSRQWRRIEATLQECVTVALQMGYLLDCIDIPPKGKDKMGMYQFLLNPAKCKRAAGASNSKLLTVEEGDRGQEEPPE